MNRPVSLSRRQLLVDALAGAGAATLLPFANAFAGDGFPNSVKSAPPTHAKPPTGSVRDFDFFVGKWNSVNRRLKRRWVGSDDWDVFPNTVDCHSHMGGVVNIDEIVFPTKGWEGMTVRTFNIEKKQWSLYWINSKTGELFPPVVGGFVGDDGEFYGDDTDEGKPIKVVFKWTRLAPGKARWQQAFSLDGKNWETNWVVDHTRIDA
ncbi:hypothetical protein [Luteimonas gilva]|uniref:hypothetical protein n=1 Tax=Luteimonas gilva TaxID=2572684 RepID=UPI001CB8BA26|nr:hypothetical protein [Luteimonas gilva]